MLFIAPTSVSGKCRVCMHDISRLVNWWTTTLCLAIQSPSGFFYFYFYFLHEERRCNHVSLLFLEHRVQLGYLCM